MPVFPLSDLAAHLRLAERLYRTHFFRILPLYFALSVPYLLLEEFGPAWDLDVNPRTTLGVTSPWNVFAHMARSLPAAYALGYTARALGHSFSLRIKAAEQVGLRLLSIVAYGVLNVAVWAGPFLLLTRNGNAHLLAALLALLVSVFLSFTLSAVIIDDCSLLRGIGVSLRLVRNNLLRVLKYTLVAGLVAYVGLAFFGTLYGWLASSEWARILRAETTSFPIALGLGWTLLESLASLYTSLFTALLYLSLKSEK